MGLCLEGNSRPLSLCRKLSLTYITLSSPVALCELTFRTTYVAMDVKEDEQGNVTSELLYSLDRIWHRDPGDALPDPNRNELSTC